jgi:hypothetical protein
MEGLGDGEFAFVEPLPQRLAVEQFRNQVRRVLSDIVDHEKRSDGSARPPSALPIEMDARNLVRPQTGTGG